MHHLFLLQAATVQSMHTVLENLYNEMLPLCSQLINAAQLIAAFGALFFIGYRVWKHIANAEPIDFFPLLRPFVISIVIGLFPQVLSVINGVLKPTVLITQSMVTDTNKDIDNLLHQRDLATRGKGPDILITDPGGVEAWNKYGAQDGSGGGFWGTILTSNWSQVFKMLLSGFLELLYYAASLTIDCLRTFHLVILAILGPIAFALSVFDGFQHTMTTWLARYINIYLWLPVANLFGALIGRFQAGMLRLDIGYIQQGMDAYFGQTDAAYLIFMIIGIIGYFTIPSVANHIVHASGGGGLMNKVNTVVANQINFTRMLSKGDIGGGAAMQGGGAGNAGNAGNAGSNGSNQPGNNTSGGGASGYMTGKLSGK